MTFFFVAELISLAGWLGLDNLGRLVFLSWQGLLVQSLSALVMEHRRALLIVTILISVFDASLSRRVVEAGLIVALRCVTENSLHLVLNLFLLTGLLNFLLMQGLVIKRATCRCLLSVHKGRLIGLVLSWQGVLVDHTFDCLEVIR